MTDTAIRLQPVIDRSPVEQIEPALKPAVLKKQEARGDLETARRTQAFASRALRNAVGDRETEAQQVGLCGRLSLASTDWNEGRVYGTIAIGRCR